MRGADVRRCRGRRTLLDNIYVYDGLLDTTPAKSAPSRWLRLPVPCDPRGLTLRAVLPAGSGRT
eukprot:3808595-Rhodomonas_salina.4